MLTKRFREIETLVQQWNKQKDEEAGEDGSPLFFGFLTVRENPKLLSQVSHDIGIPKKELRAWLGKCDRQLRTLAKELIEAVEKLD